MSCHEMRELLDGYVDSELDVVTTLQVERHLKECASCQAFYKDYEQLTRAVEAHLPRFDAPVGLEVKVRSQLGLSRNSPTRISGTRFADWHRWALAASLVALFC